MAGSKEQAMARDPGDQRRADLRASDADRERFVEALGRHHADGRLTTEELAERTERAYAARTLGDLDALATDLPAPPTSARPRPAAPPGQPVPPPLPPRLRPAGPRRAAGQPLLRARALRRRPAPPRPLSHRRGSCVQCPGDPTGPSPWAGS